MKIGSVKTGNAETQYFSFGNGSRNLIILPGLGILPIVKSARAVELAYRIFSEQFTVWVIDRPEPLPSPVTVEQLADETAAVMDRLGINSADVFGASFGGMIAQYLAINHKAKVSSLILGSTLSRANPTMERVGALWCENAESGDISALCSSFISRLYSEKTAAQMAQMGELLFAGVTENDLTRFIALAKAIKDFDVYDRLDEIGCPVFVIGVEGDKVVTAEASREIAEKLGCALYIYPNEYGHCVFDEAPDYRQRMIDFLNG